MIKRTGCIYNLTPGASRAVQFQLFEKGMKWHDEDARYIVVTGTIYWDGHYLMTYSALSGFEPHTLRDFNLREDGTQLVPNEGACDLRGCSEGVRREVQKLVSEALPTKELSDQQRAANADFYVWNPKYMFVETEGWDGEDDLMTPADLGIYEPGQSVDTPKQFEFGDKVNSDNGNQWWVVGGCPGLTFIVGDKRAFDSIAKGKEHEDSEDVQVICSTRLTPWPQHETIEISDELHLVVLKDRAWLQDKAGNEMDSVDAEALAQKLNAAIVKIRKA